MLVVNRGLMLALALVGTALIGGCNPTKNLLIAKDPTPVDLPIDTVRALTCDVVARHSAAVTKSYEPERTGERMTLTFAELNRANRTAQLIGNQGAEDVTYEVTSFAGSPQAIFIERTGSGNVTVTSVFFASSPPGSGFDDANPTVRGPTATVVHSRHILMGSIDAVPTAMVSQYVGLCQLK